MKGLLTTILCCLLITSYGQTVVIGNYPKTVPQGKKWILPTGKDILIEVSSGTLRSGNMCNALILSNPKIVKGIVEGDYGRTNEAYAILFKQLDKVAYTNDYTYIISPVSIVDSKFSLYDLQYKKVDEVGSKKIVFYQGQKVYVGECLQSIQLQEVSLTTKELADIKKKEEDARLAEVKKKQEEDNKKLKAEQERRERIINSSDFFDSNELTIENDIRITVLKDAIPIFYDYLSDFKERYAFSYENKMEIYGDNLKWAFRRGAKPEDYAMFSFSLYFDKKGDLKKITNNRILIKGEGIRDLDLEFSWFKKLKPFTSINTPALIKLDDQNHLVNSYFISYFTFDKDSSNSSTHISINKKGEAKIKINNSKYTEDEVLKMVKESRHSKFQGLEKGKYLVTITTDRFSFRYFYFQNYDNKEIIKTEKEVHFISSIAKI